ncbi:MAG: sigma-70 family RNA polymerase sigma factor [Pararhodobacter sp.]|nr:sigma-70 family RNA polymerase sigma factor [Pararhodobacter sp.]
MRRFALKLCGNLHRADDLVQTTFLKAWTKRDQFSPGTDLRGWLFTILRNTFYSELRKFRREVEDVDGKLTAALFEEPAQEHAVDLARLISAIGTLPAIHRQPLMMVGLYGYSQHEAAKACGCAVGTIKSRLSRGRESLHRSLDPVIMA